MILEQGLSNSELFSDCFLPMPIGLGIWFKCRCIMPDSLVTSSFLIPENDIQRKGSLKPSPRRFLLGQGQSQNSPSSKPRPPGSPPWQRNGDKIFTKGPIEGVQLSARKELKFCANTRGMWAGTKRS